MTVNPISTGLTITNPLVLYRALLATKRIEPDPAQHRLALHLQKLYFRLKDYEPEIEYSRRLEQIGLTVGKSSEAENRDGSNKNNPVGGIFSTFQSSKAEKNVLALTRQLTSQESAMQLQSPRGLLLYGEVGTGKSMLVDLLADSLPNRKKRRWHFNTFMLETFARLEQLRRKRAAESGTHDISGGQAPEHSLLWLARDMIATSPILFLDEFQLPDRAASKILSNLLTSFFHLGGVLIATSNRMPEELAHASGVQFAPPPASRLGLLGNRWGLLGSNSSRGRSESLFDGKGDFAAFLEVLRARCEVWDMEGNKDWRRREAEGMSQVAAAPQPLVGAILNTTGFGELEAMAPGNLGLGYEQSVHTRAGTEENALSRSSTKTVLPKNYFVMPSTIHEPEYAEEVNRAWEAAVLCMFGVPGTESSISSIPWESHVFRVYGRQVLIPRCHRGITMWSFAELCGSNLGPADYISLASTFHTIVLYDVPVLTLLQKNEARRLITLLDALYEARCKLLIRAEAGPDDILFPSKRSGGIGSMSQDDTEDGTYAETFSEIYQDQTSPFRPNISSYTPSSSIPSYASSPLPSSPYNSSSGNASIRSILADEDSDFGPVYGAGRSSNSNIQALEPTSQYRNTRGPGDGAPGAGNEIGHGLDFQRTSILTGEDERFSYKRARSRLWEMCGTKWWSREEAGWWQPVAKDVRRWEGAFEDLKDASLVENTEMVNSLAEEGMHGVSEDTTKGMIKHGASPFRTSEEPPPKISWVHAWGMMKWGKKAGAWGQGVEGLVEREKRRSDAHGTGNKVNDH